MPLPTGRQASAALSGRLTISAATSVGNGLKPFPTKDFGPPRKRDFAKLNLHLDIFEQAGRYHFFTNLLNP